MQQGHRGLPSLLFAELGKKQQHKTYASNDQEMNEMILLFFPFSFFLRFFFLSAFTGLPGTQACSWEINQDYIYASCALCSGNTHGGLRLQHIRLFSPPIHQVGTLSYFLRRHGGHGIFSRGRWEHFGIWSVFTFPRSAFQQQQPPLISRLIPVRAANVRPPFFSLLKLYFSIHIHSASQGFSGDK